MRTTARVLGYTLSRGTRVILAAILIACIGLFVAYPLGDALVLKCLCAVTIAFACGMLYADLAPIWSRLPEEVSDLQRRSMDDAPDNAHR